MLVKGTLVRLKEQYAAHTLIKGWETPDPRCNPGIVMKSSGKAAEVFWSNVEDVEMWSDNCLEILS